MKAFALRWLSGDERTLGAFLVLGVMTMAFFRLPTLRDELGVPEPELALAVVLVAVAGAWWTMLPRGYVWLDPADLTWRDLGGVDRVTLISGRLTGGWLLRQLALGYLLALLAAIVAAPAGWTVAGAAVLFAGGAVAFGALRGLRRALVPEAVAVLALAAFAVVVRPGPVMSYVLAAVLVASAVPLLARPFLANVGRGALVDGWHDRVLRVSGVQFLDLALLLPAARPVRPRGLGPPTGLRLAWLGTLGRARHLPTAALLAFAAVAAHLAFPRLSDLVVFPLLGYLAVVPLTAGLGELWRSPGRRRWVGRSDTALRLDHLLVATALAAAWAAPVFLAGPGWSPTVLVTVPVIASCAVRTMTRRPPTYDNLVPVDTPFGALPLRLVFQTLRGPDAGVLAVPLIAALPLWGAALVVAAVVALALFR